MSTQDLNPKATFEQQVVMAIETDQRGEAPSGNNLFWWQGGGWFPVTTDGLPTLYDQQALIFPTGHAGRRSMNAQPPVPGRKWASGDVNAFATTEFLGQWLTGALGNASHNTVPSTTHELLASSAIEADGDTFALTTQPTDSGAILHVLLQGTTGSGRFTVAGNDSDGNATSETISFDAAGSMYTRTSFSSVTGITFDSIQTLGGSIGVSGIRHFIHDITTATSNPTFSIERLNDPSAGAASKSFMHPGMVIQTLTLDTPAAVRDGVTTVSSTWEGDPTATCTEKTVSESSSVRIIPAWTLSLTRDGTAYTRPTNLSFTINSGNRNYRSAAGVQNPQGTFFGGREVTFSTDLILDDETEFNRWRGASRQNLVLTWTSPWVLSTGHTETLTASMTSAYLETAGTADDDGMFSLSVEGRTIINDTDEILHLQLKDGIPPSAYGGSTVIT